MARLNFLLERSSLYAKILEARINQQKEEQAKKPAVEKDTAKPPKTTGKGKKRARASDSYDIAGHIDSSTLEKANKRARGEKVKEEEQTTSLPSMEQPDLITGARLKDYQLEGVRWIASLWENGLNGILADEMGLGFVDHNIMHTSLIHVLDSANNLIPCAHEIQRGVGPVPHCLPSERAAQLDIGIPVCMYHGSPQHRAELRQTVLRQPTSIASLPKPKRGRPKKKTDDELPEQTTQTFPVIVTTYDMVIRDRIHLAKFGWKYIVVDEGHRLKNMNCKLIQELKQYPSANRLILTGTPLHNNLAELWSLLNFILPDIFNDLHSFQQWFNFSENTDLGDQTAGIVSQLHAILKPFLLRRLKTDVVTDLPPKKEYVLYAPLTSEQKDLYQATLEKDVRDYLMKQALDALEKDEEKEEVEEVVDEKDDKRKLRKRTKPAAPAYLLEDDDDTYFDALERGDYDIPEETEEERRKKERDAAKKQTIRGVNNQHLQNVVMQLRKVCSHPYLFDWPTKPDSDESVVDDTLVAKSGKMLLLERMLDELLKRGHKVLIFSQFTTVLDIIQQWLTHCKDLEHCRIDGSTSPEDRREQMDWFNKSGHGHDDPRIFLLSTRAGGLGINLVGADTVIFFDQDWNPQMDLQAQDRAHRIGQTKPVLIFRLICQHTIETKIMQSATNKRKLEAMVIAKDKFRGFESRKSRNENLVNMANEMLQLEGEKINLVHHGDKIISDADMDVLLDRRPEVFTQRSKGWTGKNEGTFEVYEAEKDEGNDGLARMAATNAASAESQQDVVMASEGVDNYELPKTLVTRIVKSAIPENAKVQREAMHAFLKGSTVFINYLAATAHELSRARGHKSVGAADVIKAIETIEFNTDGLVKFLEMDLEAYRQGTKKPKPAAKPKPKQGDATTTAGASVAASASASTPASASGRKLKIVVAPIRDDDETGPMEGEVVEMRQEDEEEEEVGEDVDELEDDVDEEPDETVTEGVSFATSGVESSMMDESFRSTT
ncbi:SNF2 family N-terminal domain [Rhizoctonia solani]|uniref:SNF2 family N-terminal domain n=1 Tax=Rhizoctonia solani TaxID=456999 RepID=A0A8H7H0P2_9AGAM|nr:SNF2 family N-terminal domain [Rhizoctonia solani]